jgi:hypothetical protein
MPTTHAPSLVQLRRAIELSEEIQKLEAELKAIFTEDGTSSIQSASEPAAEPKTRGARKGRKLSPETRARMAAAQQARHARKNGPAAEVKAMPKSVKKSGGKRTLSPEALERIREGQKKRWAKVRKGK